MPGGNAYTSRAPRIINVTLTLANTWYLITPQLQNVRKWYMKSSENTNNAYDYCWQTDDANSVPPVTYATNGGQGTAFDGCQLESLWVRSATAATIIEIVYWN